MSKCCTLLLLSASFFCSKAHWSLQVEFSPQWLAHTSSVIFPLVEFDFVIAYLFTGRLACRLAPLQQQQLMSPFHVTLRLLCCILRHDRQHVNTHTYTHNSQYEHSHTYTHTHTHTQCMAHSHTKSLKKELAKLQIEEPVTFRELMIIE